MIITVVVVAVVVVVVVSSSSSSSSSTSGSSSISSSSSSSSGTSRSSPTVNGYGNSWFKKTDPSSLLPYLPNRITWSIWTDIPDVLTCAYFTLKTFPVSQGFLFNAASGRCCPLAWLEGASAPGALTVQPSEGILYLTPDFCNNGFQIMEIGTTGELACLRYFDNDPKNYEDARTHCSSLGAYLVSVKTFKKLELIRSFVTEADSWVGLDDIITEGVFVWAIGGDTLTNQQINALFDSGEPNDKGGNEHCVEYKIDDQLLNDVACGFLYDYICEKPLPAI
ncbi:LOW QUALITY PROTEIN: C-type lectin-related protein 4 [Elysia marginata]|uniref:C-type lectin-related protein 4 n=1 Tax=Elysia marginata TaxID=1093978 RepID=A0AAV4H1D2_9GAST|nr:LOW QUALITY PROTEIN: C-type lectin-related protein 4 [Elysia marginata]